MKRVISIVVLLAFVSTATAGPKAILVLKAEGTADATTRTNLDASVLKLAKNLDGKVEMGDITLTDAAAIVGCNPSDASCKDDVLATLGVDEIVATTATSVPTGTNVTVRRLAKGSSPRAAQSVQPAGKPSDTKLTQDIGALFGVSITTAPANATPTPPPTPPTTTATKVSTPPTNASPPASNPAYDTPYLPGQNPEHPQTAQVDQRPIDNSVSGAPNGQVAPVQQDTPRSYRWQKVGMIAGGTMVVVGFLLWSKASDVQGEIDAQPANTPADFKTLQQLESDADGYAGGGNLFFLTGLVVGGISAYSYWHGHRQASTHTARITPVLTPTSAGIALTFGAVP
ncbi:MAG TPA: hypothetical protein VL326_11895 [Kofleriaceae bacterium]|nr:hypothetical protein [Kofleriaceae bacterium]